MLSIKYTDIFTMLHHTKFLIQQTKYKTKESHFCDSQEKERNMYQGKDDIVFLRAKGLFRLIALLIILVL